MTNLQRAFVALALIAVAAAAWYRSRVLNADEETHAAPVDIVLVTGGSGPYWQLAANGARQAADDVQANVQIEMPSDAESLAEQLQILKEIDAQTTGGVAVSPLDAAGQTELINGLAKDLFVVTFDSDAPDSERIGYVGTSNFAAGRVCARLVAEAMPKGGKIVVLMANETKDNLQDRKGGLQEVVAQLNARSKADVDAGDTPAPQWEVAGFLTDGGDDDACAENIRQVLGREPDVACFVGLNARHGPVLMDVIRAEGKLGKVQVIAFDGDPKTLDGIEAGHIYAAVIQDPYLFGYEAVRMLAKLCRGAEEERPIGAATFSVTVKTVRLDNLDEYRAQLKARQSAAKATPPDDA
jgi:ribose transport system substrate-binding protein